MQWTRAAKADKDKVTWIKALLNREEACAACHIVIDNIDDRLRCLLNA